MAISVHKIDNERIQVNEAKRMDWRASGSLNGPSIGRVF